MSEPNLDIGLDYTGGINKPTPEQVGNYARVMVDAYGAPNLEYVPGVERRVFVDENGALLTGTLAKTTLIQTITIPANTMLDVSKRLRVMLYGQMPARAGTLVGIDTFTSGISSQLHVLSISGTPLLDSAFFYEFTFFPTAPAINRVFGRLTCDQVAVKTSTLSTTLNMAVDQRIDLTAQLANAADTIRFRRVEVWQIG